MRMLIENHYGRIRTDTAKDVTRYSKNMYFVWLFNSKYSNGVSSVCVAGKNRDERIFKDRKTSIIHRVFQKSTIIKEKSCVHSSYVSLPRYYLKRCKSKLTLKYLNCVWIWKKLSIYISYGSFSTYGLMPFSKTKSLIFEKSSNALSAIARELRAEKGNIKNFHWRPFSWFMSSFFSLHENIQRNSPAASRPFAPRPHSPLAPFKYSWDFFLMGRKIVAKTSFRPLSRKGSVPAKLICF